MNDSNLIPLSEQKFVDDFVAKMQEHFDSVRVFVSRHDGMAAETGSYTSGGGNFHAQFGQVVGWVEEQRQLVRNEADGV